MKLYTLYCNIIKQTIIFCFSLVFEERINKFFNLAAIRITLLPALWHFEYIGKYYIQNSTNWIPLRFFQLVKSPFIWSSCNKTNTTSTITCIHNSQIFDIGVHYLDIKTSRQYFCFHQVARTKRLGFTPHLAGLRW